MEPIQKSLFVLLAIFVALSFGLILVSAEDRGNLNVARAQVSNKDKRIRQLEGALDFCQRPTSEKLRHAGN